MRELLIMHNQDILPALRDKTFLVAEPFKILFKK